MEMLVVCLTIDHDTVLIDGRIINLNPLQVEMGSIILIEEASRDIGDILSSIAFASDINLIALHAKGLDKASPEVIELI